jgi:hypothetical protein
VAAKWCTRSVCVAASGSASKPVPRQRDILIYTRRVENRVPCSGGCGFESLHDESSAVFNNWIGQETRNVNGDHMCAGNVAEP